MKDILLLMIVTFLFFLVFASLCCLIVGARYEKEYREKILLNENFL